MDFDLIRAVNAHFQPFYAYAAEEIHARYGRDAGDALEIGPYGPGVALALAARCPGMRLVCGDDSDLLNGYLAERIASAGMSARVRVAPLDKYRLPFEADAFDLVIFRGGLFFWERQEEILGEMNRVLRPGAPESARPPASPQGAVCGFTGRSPGSDEPPPANAGECARGRFGWGGPRDYRHRALTSNSISSFLEFRFLIGAHSTPVNPSCDNISAYTRSTGTRTL